MRMKTAARGLTLFVGLAVALSVMAVPAAATEPGAIASIRAAQRTVLAGTPEAPFEITVTNVPDTAPGPPSTTPNINCIRVVPPPGFYTALPVFQAPAGWNFVVGPDGHIRFWTNNNADVIVPGASAAFTAIASIARPTVDRTSRWRVHVSGTTCNTAREAKPDPAAVSPPNPDSQVALQTTIRVLQVLNTRITLPLGATDNSVSAGQTVDVALDVTNAGSGTLGVTPNVTFQAASGGNASATLIRSASCPDGSAGFPARSMGPQTTTTFTCQVRFQRPEAAGTNGNGTLTGRASGAHPDGPSTALTSSLGVTVMTAAVFNFVDNSLQPTDVSPGRAFIFRLSVSKRGEVSVNLTKANTTLAFGPAEDPDKFTATLNEPAVVPAGGTSTTPLNVLLEFSSTTIPADMPANDGTGKREYDPTLQITGTDQNDFPVSQAPDVTDNILVDALGPIINLDPPIPPPSRVQGEDAAASNGLTITFTGDISDRGSPCGACPIVSAVVRQFRSDQTQIVGADIPVTIRNDQGNLSGTFNGSYHPDALFMALRVIGADPGGNTTPAQSDLLDVDNIIPRVLTGITGTDLTTDPDGDEIRVNRRIDVRVSENLAAPGMSPSDWIVSGHRVVAAEPQDDCDSEASSPSRQNFTCVRLTVDPELGRNEETNVTYAPTAGSRANDRVGLLLPNATVLAVDGIVPIIPDVLAISGMEKQEGDDGMDRFFTNDDTPAILIDVDPGDQVTVYEDCVENPDTPGAECGPGSVEGELDDGDAAKCTATADPDETEVTCLASSFGTTDRDVTIFSRSVDARDNVGDFSDDPLTLDFTRPVIQGVQFVVNDIQVNFSERLGDLRTSNSLEDWVVRGRDAGVNVDFVPDRVEGSESNTRFLRGNGSWNAPGVTVLQVRYTFFEVVDPHQRFSDRAGNEVLDTVIVV